jgi:hypothetical protein
MPNVISFELVVIWHRCIAVVGAYVPPADIANHTGIYKSSNGSLATRGRAPTLVAKRSQH